MQTLAFGFMGNGVTIWHRGTEEHGYAHINDDRSFTYTYGFTPTEEEEKEIIAFAERGNMAFYQGNDPASGYLVLPPVNKPTRVTYNLYMEEFYLLSVENVGGKELLCCGKTIWNRKPEEYDTIEQAQEKLHQELLIARTEWQYHPNEEKRIAMLAAEKKYNQFINKCKAYGIYQ